MGCLPFWHGGSCWLRRGHTRFEVLDRVHGDGGEASLSVLWSVVFGAAAKSHPAVLFRAGVSAGAQACVAAGQAGSGRRLSGQRGAGAEGVARAASGVLAGLAGPASSVCRAQSGGAGGAGSGAAVGGARVRSCKWGRVNGFGRRDLRAGAVVACLQMWTCGTCQPLHYPTVCGTRGGACKRGLVSVLGVRALRCSHEREAPLSDRNAGAAPGPCAVCRAAVAGCGGGAGVVGVDGAIRSAHPGGGGSGSGYLGAGGWLSALGGAGSAARGHGRGGVLGLSVAGGAGAGGLPPSGSGPGAD